MALDERGRAARLSVVSNTVLVIAKLVIGVAMGSISVISEAAHSGIDLIASLIAFFAVRESRKPADRDHPFGHGKVENFSGSIEGLLILFAAVFIVYEAIGRVVKGGDVGMPLLGVCVMGLSTAVNTGVSIYLFRVARRTGSFALEADAEHLRTDVFTSLGVLVAMLLIHFTGLTIIDPIAAMAVALLIGFIAIDLMRKGYGDLVDRRLPDEEEAVIRRAIEAHPEIIGYHDLRTRRSGQDRFIDLHALVASRMDIVDSHAATQRIEEEIGRALPGSRITIHIEPCDGDCGDCEQPCPAENRRPGGPLRLPGEEALRERITGLVAGVEGIRGIDDLHLHRALGKWDIHIDVVVSPELTVGAGHDLSRRVEGVLRAGLEDAGKVAIHVEPEGHSDAPTLG